VGLVDLVMSVMNGLARDGRKRAVQPEAGIVTVTGGDHAALSEVAAVGAQALVTKRVRPEAMLRCLRTVACRRRRCPHCL
jgi:DNA-binding NarL/FixJ family response regulator